MRAKVLVMPTKTLITSLNYAFLADKEGCFRPSGNEKTLFKEGILEANKFIIGRSFQSPVIDNHDNICH